MKERLNKKSGKLWLAIQKGKTSKEAAKEVGIDPRNVSHLKATDNYQALERSSFKEEILKHILASSIAEEHVKLIKQNEDKGVKLGAIKLAYETIEPEIPQEGEDQKVIVVLR